MPQLSATVLVVDDEAVVLNLVSAALTQQLGCAVLTADNGQDALKLLREQDVSLLLTDIVMPGMNGTELVRQARLIKPDMPACFITGFCEQYETQGRGAQFIQKPFDLSHLASVVTTILSPSRARKGPRLNRSGGTVRTRR